MSPSLQVAAGRLDQMLLAVAQRVCARYIEPRLGVSLWSQLEKPVQQGIRALRVPRKPLSPEQMELARIGLQAARGILTQRRLSGVR